MSSIYGPMFVIFMLIITTTAILSVGSNAVNADAIEKDAINNPNAKYSNAFIANYVVVDISDSEYYEACDKLTDVYSNIPNLKSCIVHFEENSNITGKDVLDHFNSKYAVVMNSRYASTFTQYTLDRYNVVALNYNACDVLTDVANKLDINDCILYAWNNSQSTGQDVLDHYDISPDKIPNYDILTIVLSEYNTR